MTEGRHDRLQHDDELRRRFARLRAEVESHTPSFDELRRPVRQPQARAPRARAVGRLVGMAVAASLLVLVSRDFIGRARHTQESDADVDGTLATATWKGPTDFLLKTRTRALLRAIPSIGSLKIADTVPARVGQHISHRDPSHERNQS